MKKLIFLSLILFIGIPISCVKKSSTFRIESLALTLGKFDTENDLGSFTEVSYNQGNEDTLSVSQLVVEVLIEETSLIASSANAWFLSSAYADVAPPTAESKLSLISIYSDKSLFAGGREYQPGDNLTNIFTISSRYYPDATTILQFIEQFEKWYEDDNLYLKVSVSIDQPLAQSLKVDVTLENGTVFMLETEKVVVR